MAERGQSQYIASTRDVMLQCCRQLVVDGIDASMTVEGWEKFESYADEASAEALVELLRSKGVPARVETLSPIPGVVENVVVMVSSELAHRARFVIASQQVSNEELEYVATGELNVDE